MTTKPAAKKADAPDDVYSNSYVHPLNLDGYDPTYYMPTFAPLPESIDPSVPVVVPADQKES